MKVRIPAILSITALSALPAFADVSDTEFKLAKSCFETRDWSCALDQYATIYASPSSRPDCLSAGGECWAVSLTLLVTAVGAAENAGPLERRFFAERAINIIRSLNKQEFDDRGELFLSALRYDACRSLKEEGCMAESADLIRLAVANRPNFRTSPPSLNYFFDQVGIRYPIDLIDVVTEVEKMEPKE